MTGDHKVFAISFTFAFVTFSIVSLRLYVRGVLIGSLHSDDWAAIVAVFCSLSSVIVQCVADIVYKAGGGGTIHEIQGGACLLVVYSVIYPIAISATRVSVLLFYKRLAIQSNAFVYRVSNILLALTPFYVLAFCLPWFFLCRPMSAFWATEDVRQKHCAGGSNHAEVVHRLAITTIFVNMAADTVLWLLPVRMIWHMKMSTKTRLGVIFLMILGLFAVLVGLLRAIRFFNYSKIQWDRVHSDLWYIEAWRLTILQELEILIGLMACSIAPLKRLFKGKRSRSVDVEKTPTLFRELREAFKRPKVEEYEMDSTGLVTDDSPSTRNREVDGQNSMEDTSGGPSNTDMAVDV